MFVRGFRFCFMYVVGLNVFVGSQSPGVVMLFVVRMPKAARPQTASRAGTALEENGNRAHPGAGNGAIELRRTTDPGGEQAAEEATRNHAKEFQEADEERQRPENRQRANGRASRTRGSKRHIGAKTAWKKKSMDGRGWHKVGRDGNRWQKKENMLRIPAQEQMVENDGDKWHQGELGR